MEQMGKYQLIRKLASGGMAEVFLARAAGPKGFEKVLVLKRILPHLAEESEFIEMFLTEARLAARLNHANVVQIFDFGEESGTYFIAMEYVEGPNLRALARQAFKAQVPIAPPLIARILAQACEGLAFAHEQGLIHRDISSDNILVSRSGGVKVVDFGIAKAADASHRTRSGVLKGKVSYMSPEHLLGKPLDARADIYALGVVLYELLAGRKPFEAESEGQLVRAILHESPVGVRALRKDVPAELSRILDKALARDREARYRSCRELQADLEGYLHRCGQPVGTLQVAELVKQLVPVLPGDELEPAPVPESTPPKRGTRSRSRAPATEASSKKKRSRVGARKAAEPTVATGSGAQTRRSRRSQVETRPYPPELQVQPVEPAPSASLSRVETKPYSPELQSELQGLTVEPAPSAPEAAAKAPRPRRRLLPIIEALVLLMLLAGVGLLGWHEVKQILADSEQTAVPKQSPHEEPGEVRGTRSR
jgi:eukaryotic-like serine/threonine-protein kinase